MRLSVRLGVKINLSPEFSRVVEKAPDTPKMKCFTSCPSLSPVNLIPGSGILLKRKENSSQASHRRSSGSVVLPHNIHVQVQEY